MQAPAAARDYLLTYWGICLRDKYTADNGEGLEQTSPSRSFPCRLSITRTASVKRLLQDAAMGMTPENPWNGFNDATGGQIIVKKDGDKVYYHIYELNRYLQYWFDSTKLDQPSTGEDETNPGHVRLASNGKPQKPFLYRWSYKENGQYYIKINLQIRFK